jgi:dTDP-4-dehydrorhamnose 3,5-epimerase
MAPFIDPGRQPPMEVVETSIADVKIVRPRRYADDRGVFHETYRRDRYVDAGIVDEFVQDNHVVSHLSGTVRGLHFQSPPAAQAKLVWPVRGAIFDVVVDLRVGSPTFGGHVAIELSPDDGQIYVPIGFAHGYCTLEAATEVVYKVSAPYAPDQEGGILWNDPELGIPWPIAEKDAVLAPRDTALPLLADLPAVFSGP